MNFWIASVDTSIHTPVWQEPAQTCDVSGDHLPVTLQPGDSVVFGGSYPFSGGKIAAGTYRIQANVAIIGNNAFDPVLDPIGAGMITIGGS